MKSIITLTMNPAIDKSASVAQVIADKHFMRGLYGLIPISNQRCSQGGED